MVVHAELNGFKQRRLSVIAASYDQRDSARDGHAFDLAAVGK